MKNRKLYLIALAPFVIGLLIGSFFDYEISSALFMDPKTNIFGIIFSAFMPIVSYSFFSFCAGYSLQLFIKEKQTFWKLFELAGVIGFYGVAVYFTQDKFITVNAFAVFDGAEKFKPLVWIGCILTDGAIGYLGFKAAKINGTREFLFQSVVIAAAIMVSLVPFSQILKVIIRRPRFRSIEYLMVPGARFTNWWEPFRNDFYSVISPTYSTQFKDLSEEFKSFPSGHAGEAAMTIIGLPYIFSCFPKLKGKETLGFVLGLGFTILMSFSRITMGAHYLTDVSIGVLMSILCCIVAYEANLKFFIKKENNQQI